MDDLLAEFLTETSENIGVIDMQLVEFEKDPNNNEILQNIFRLVHTIKGTCGFLGLPRLESVAHAGENVLDQFRDGKLEVTPSAVTLILRCIDAIKDLLGGLEQTGAEPEGDDVALIAELNALASGETAAPAAAASSDGETGGTSVNEFGAPVAAELLAEVEAASGGTSVNEFGAPVAAELLAEVEAASGGTNVNEFGAPVAAELLAEVEAASGGASAEPQAKAEPEKPKVPAAKAKDNKPAEAKPAKEAPTIVSSIRVNVDMLEGLMTLVSELVLTRNQLLQMVRDHEDSEFEVPLQRLSHITSDLQEGVMKTRMQPIGNAWAKLPRIVRDLALETDKKIDLQMLGADTELDRQVLELIKDPLTHMVRNSADHGLEGIEDRLAADKPEIGVIVLNAFHEGGHIIIEISDDGRGLNMEKIREKVLQNGLATDAELEGMSDQQVQQYIFKAGFSTAEKVTSVSGRGVGMDVVRTNIEKIGGNVELKSVIGEGSTFTIKIPLTLAIVSALIVECGGQRFAIPQISVQELVRASMSGDNQIEMINDAPVLRLRNRLLPLVSLRKLLKLGDSDIDVLAKEIAADTAGDVETSADKTSDNVDDSVAAETGSGNITRDELFIVVAQVGTNSFGILVDKVFDTEEIVVKPVAPILRDISCYSGNTILGDGSVIMILDPNGIASEIGDAGVGKTDHHDAHVASVTSQDEKTSMLIFRAGGEDLKAIPLALVARLEEVDMEAVEHSHGYRVVQYRGHLMPLIPSDPGHEWKEKGRQPVLVFTENERSMGLVVSEIVDIVEDRIKVELSSGNLPGLVGSAIIAGKATDIIDAGYYLTQAFSDWFGNADEPNRMGSESELRILLVDDSSFFRNLLSPVLSAAGYHVTAVNGAGDALKLREDGTDFDVIISDIEMPDMNGFDFAADVRAKGRWQNTPMVALSAHASDSDFERGREVGFNEYIAKFDREELVNTLVQIVANARVAPDS